MLFLAHVILKEMLVLEVDALHSDYNLTEHPFVSSPHGGDDTLSNIFEVKLEVLNN